MSDIIILSNELSFFFSLLIFSLSVVIVSQTGRELVLVIFVLHEDDLYCVLQSVLNEKFTVVESALRDHSFLI